MKKEVKIIEGLCPANHPCPVINICPKNAIIQLSWNAEPSIDKERCTNCGICTKYCGYGAFKYTNK